MTDIGIKDGIGEFKLRVAGIIIKNNKILVQKSKRHQAFCFPGGHVEIGETTKEAVIRELKEEVKANFEIINLFCISENLYNSDGKMGHEICFYYKLNSLNNIPDCDFEVKELDKGVEKIHNYCWLEIEKIVDQNLRPTDVSRLIEKSLDENEHIIFIDNRY